MSERDCSDQSVSWLSPVDWDRPGLGVCVFFFLKDCLALVATPLALLDYLSL